MNIFVTKEEEIEIKKTALSAMIKMEEFMSEYYKSEIDKLKEIIIKRTI